MEQNTPEVLTKNEVADLLKVSIKTLERWEKDGILVPFRLSRSVRYRAEDVAAVINQGGAA